MQGTVWRAMAARIVSAQDEISGGNDKHDWRSADTAMFEIRSIKLAAIPQKAPRKFPEKSVCNIGSLE